MRENARCSWTVSSRRSATLTGEAGDISPSTSASCVTYPRCTAIVSERSVCGHDTRSRRKDKAVKVGGRLACATPYLSA